LQNWQVVEIEGEARLVSERDLAPEIGDAAEGADQVDTIIIAGLPERRIVVQPGNRATLVVSLLNNGPEAALFDVNLEGWIHESWLPDGPRKVSVRPGERTAALLTIAPPRHGSISAGEYLIVIVVRSPQYGRRVTRLRATLVVEPFCALSVGNLHPASVELGSIQRDVTLSWPITNQGNQPLTLQTHGQSVGPSLHFDFRHPSSPNWIASPAVVDLAPQQTLDLMVRATIQDAPLFALQPLQGALRLFATPTVEAHPPRAADADFVYRPLIKPWHLAVLATAAALLLMTTGMIALAARLVLGTVGAPSAPAVAAPPVVIVLNQQPPQSPGAEIVAGDEGVRTIPADLSAAEPGVPIVQPGQVTRPGEPAPASKASAKPGEPAAFATGGAPAPYTYGEMFQEIALRYDLDWKLLAAQAYVESSFDTLALGNNGDMGLMQVLPATWREWAPVVGASDPFDAYENSLVAAVYLDHVRTLLGARGRPEKEWMLVGYNWGPDRLGDFLEANGTWKDLPPERAEYASQILQIAGSIP
jgi:soluble lytic murein transglycosylase-like protein